ncbi:MAG: HesA/MoeB/ThiF family protein [Methanobrevibacter sp.]|uniref:HesA/MoeB/ThiF family protein n=1 Tax=Methanobrevibacter sp. TaxID=66852 RepID=UPI0026DF21A4|nr:HesA/MoeB/ThiF family protein [Methanobrevibacter sp.]MDO5848559.1 HesA/MoeB/ThiF family protein [Methanobrevibacter sp.]
MPTRFIGDGYWEIVTRQMSIVTKSEQTRFKDAEISVIGCGGIGGDAISMLARMGVGKLNLVDEDRFDLSNLNRQALSDLTKIGISKSEVAKETVRLINPYTEVTAFNERLDEDNIEMIISNSDIVIDAVDNLITRIIVSRYAKENDIPFVHGAIHGTMGQLTVFKPENDVSYESMFGLPSYGKELTPEVIDEVLQLTSGVPPVIGPNPNIIGCLEAMEAFKIITGIGEVLEAPQLLTYDLLNFNSFNVETL